MPRRRSSRPRGPAGSPRRAGPGRSVRAVARRRVGVGAVVIDCQDFPRMLAFWRQALGYVPRERPSNGWVVLTDPEGEGPNVSLNRTEEGPLGDYRLHLDLYTSDQKGEVARLSALGAQVRTPARTGHDYVVMADPDGNPFCVVQKGPPG